MRIGLVLTVLGALSVSLAACGEDGEGPTQTPSDEPSLASTPTTLPDDPEVLMARALRTSFRELGGVVDNGSDPTAVRAMGETGDERYIPVLIEILRFSWLLSTATEEATYSSLAALTGATYDDLDPHQFDWTWWVEWLGTQPEVELPPGFARWKGELFGQLVDPRINEFFARDDLASNIRIEEIVWGGVLRDGIPDLQNPPTLKARHADYLQANDRVFGVSFNGESRAYPLRILNAHEMANDEVGGVHFALAY